MILKEKLRNPFVQQYILEIFLPLAGYFFFDWSLLIIAAFYLIDQIGSEFSFTRKLLTIGKSEQKKIRSKVVIQILIFALLFAVQIWLLLNYFSNWGQEIPAIIFEELILFAKEELWLIFPLIILMYYIKDQFTFFMPRRFLQKDADRFWRTHLIELSVIFLLIVIGILITVNVSLSDLAIIILFLIVKISYDFTLGKYLEAKSSK